MFVRRQSSSLCIGFYSVVNNVDAVCVVMLVDIFMSLLLLPTLLLLSLSAAIIFYSGIYWALF